MSSLAYYEKRKTLTRAQKRAGFSVLRALEQCADPDNVVRGYVQDDLAEKAGYEKRQFRRIIRWLEDLGFVRAIPSEGAGRGRKPGQYVLVTP